MATTNPTINYASLDFNDIKNDLLAYIATLGTFTDYNQQGSNLNVMVQIMAYINTILAYNLNQSVNESWLATASIRENALKAIKTLNYSPSRANSAEIKVVLSNIVYDNGLPINLLKFDAITSGAYTFYHVGEAKEVTGSTLEATFKEGVLNSNATAYTGTGAKFQSFIIEDTYIGDFFELYSVVNGERVYWAEFEPGKIYLNPSTERIYFIEEVKRGYKISFGNGQLGYAPPLDEILGYDYIVPNGSQNTNTLVTYDWEGNGYTLPINSNYTFGHITGSTISLATGWEGGSLGSTGKESLKEIKFNAPKFWQTQGRAVTPADYLAFAVKHPYIDRAIAVSGTDMVPIKKGVVFVICKPDSNNYPYDTFTDATLTELRNYFLNVSVVTINPIVQNPQYVYMKINLVLRYQSDAKAPSVSSTQTAMMEFVNVQNADFGDYFEFSKFLRVIDDADSLTTSNVITISPYLKVLSEYFDTTISGYRIKSPQKLYNTSATGSSKKTYIEEVDSNGLVVNTYNEGIDYMLSYGTNDYLILTHFDPHTGGPIFETYTYKLYFVTPDNDIFLSNSQLLLLKESDITTTLEKV